MKSFKVLAIVSLFVLVAPAFAQVQIIQARRIYWVDNTFSGGVIQPPVVGKFDGSVGIFEGPILSTGYRLPYASPGR